MGLRRPDLQPLQLPRAHILHQNINAPGKLRQHLPVFLQIELDRKFVTAADAEPDRVAVLRLPSIVKWIAAGWLDIDYLRPQIGEDSGAKWRPI